jgi:DNA replication protein DnaC
MTENRELPELDDETIFAEDDPLELAAKNWRPPENPYPMTLSMGECLERQRSRYPNWDYHIWVSCKDAEVVSQQGKELWTPEAMNSTVHAGGKCPVCDGTKERTEICRGRVTNICFQQKTPCWCEEARFFDRLLGEKLPRILRNFTLKHIKPSPKSNLSHAIQEREIEFLKAHPDESFFFLGPPGTSKSVYAAALFRRALARNHKYLWHGGKVECCWRVDGNHLFESEVAYALADDKENFKRDITVEMIQTATREGLRPVLLLEEIEKRRMTEYAALTLFRLVNAMDECEGQIILTSNLSLPDFRDMFLKSDIDKVRVDGAALLRRLTDPDKVNVRDYYAIAP